MSKQSKQWRLEKIEVELETFGPNKGRYVGKIKFSNTDWESFSFNLTPEKTNDYINLIRQEVVNSAEELGQSLVESLGLSCPCEPS